MTLCLFVLPGIARAQTQDFFLTLTNTPDPILLGSNITYSLSVSNATGTDLAPLTGRIESDFPESAIVIKATNSQGVILTNMPGLVIFTNLTFSNTTVVDIELVLRPTVAGFLTNSFTVREASKGPESTNARSEVVLPEADLGVSILGPMDGVFPGDSFSYSLFATNAGPNDAASVVVSNPFPDNVRLLGRSPEGSVEAANDLVLFSIGTLTNQGSATATVSVLATNAAVTNLITAWISAPNVSDTNTANNSSTSNVPILTPEPDQVVVINWSAQQFNPQTGWVEQRVRLANVTTSGVDSVRLLVDGLTNHLVQLVNASGSNWSTPYVAHGDGLAGGAEMELILEYRSPTRSTDGPNPVWSAHGTPPLDLTPRDGTGITATNRIVYINDTESTNLNNGRILLEWPASSAAVYQVIYDHQVPFTNAKGSLPLVVTPSQANRVQWLDYGPPRTLAAPSNTAARFYKVIQLP